MKKVFYPRGQIAVLFFDTVMAAGFKLKSESSLTNTQPHRP